MGTRTRTRSKAAALLDTPGNQAGEQQAGKQSGATTQHAARGATANNTGTKQQTRAKSGNPSLRGADSALAPAGAEIAPSTDDYAAADGTATTHRTPATGKPRSTKAKNTVKAAAGAQTVATGDTPAAKTEVKATGRKRKAADFVPAQSTGTTAAVALHRMKLIDWQPTAVVAIAATSDGTAVAVAHESGDIELWDASLRHHIKVGYLLSSSEHCMSLSAKVLLCLCILHVL